MMQFRPKSSWFAWLLVLLALFFRLADLPNIRHGYDQAYQAYLALQMIESGQLLTVGQPSSIFLDNPPLMAYLQAGVLLIWDSVWAIYIFVAALNGLAVWFLYDATRQIYDEPTAVLAGFLYAVSPWLVHFGRMPWTQGLLPFFLALMAWGLWPTLATGKPQNRRFLIGLLAAIAMLQTYILAFAMLVPLALICWLLRDRVPRRPLLIGTAILTLITGIFVRGLQQAADTNSSKFNEFIREFTLGFDLVAIEHAVRYVTGVGWNGQDVLLGEVVAVPLMTHVSNTMLAVALVGGILLSIYELRHVKRRPFSIVLLIWFILPILGFGAFGFRVHPHYLLLTVPAGQLFAARAIRQVANNRVTQVGIAILLCLFAIQFNLSAWRMGQTVSASPYGPELTAWQLSETARLGATLSSFTAGQDRSLRLAIAAHPAMVSSASGQFVDIVEQVSYPDFLLIPEHEPIYYALENVSIDSVAQPDLIEPLPESTFEKRNGSRLNFVRTRPQSAESARELPETPVDWQNQSGWTLLGYDLHQGETEWILTSYWRIEALPAERMGWFLTTFAQIVNAEQQRFVNAGGHGLWGHQVQMGDVLVDQIVVPISAEIPPDNYSLIFGLYDPIHNINFYFNSAERSTPTYPIDVQLP